MSGTYLVSNHRERSGAVDQLTACAIIIIIIIIINEIYRAQNSQGQQMRQVSCCMIQLS